MKNTGAFRTIEERQQEIHSMAVKIGEARERRAALQETILSSYGIPLICLTLNIPGPDKHSKLYDAIFMTACDELEFRCSSYDFSLVCLSNRGDSAGNEAIFCANKDPIILKEITTNIEEEHPLGRIFDIDVIDSTGRIVSRRDIGQETRQCIVCGDNPQICRRLQKHALNELLSVIKKFAMEYFSSISSM